MENYLKEIQKYFYDENSSEHSYRTSFENFLKDIFPKEKGYFTQQDQKAIDGNKPDFVILKNKVPILYIEVKKVGEDLNKIEKSNQADRYFGYDNLIISDYVNFRFFRNGQRYNEEISLGDIDKNGRYIKIKEENQDYLVKTILDFVSSHKEAIKSGILLARIMGGKAQRVKDNVLYMLKVDNGKSDELLKIKEVVKENLVSNIADEDFADMYAQTLVYGLFASRYNDKTQDTFSRHEAVDLAPKTNPFLKKFFGHIAGESFPDRLKFIIDELCEVFVHADIHNLLTDFYGKEKDNKDPIIHFYEDFLREYDSKKKIEMGVFYTPKPVVDFIIRGVDYLLKNDFNLADGISSKEKIKNEKKIIDSKTGREKKIEEEYHKVQILDIATGTGTFLNETIIYIYNQFKNKGQLGGWESYAKDHLLPRLHGFEIMMASYTIAHLKLGMTLEEEGIDINKLNQRLGVYLTNTLEEAKDYSSQGTLFGLMDSIAEESKNASRIKKEYPIMCVIGNPPYSGESMNKDYTDNDVYKVEIGGKEKLKERNSKWINDDYVKFIRFAESLIEKNKEGIIGMITAHGYIDNPTFRGMRWHLRSTFDKIYVLDLHGNSRKKETTPCGEKDENIFDIMTGVSIILGIKNSLGLASRAEVYRADFYGKREEKFEKLNNLNIESIKWTKLPQETDLWVLEGKGKEEYMKGFSVSEIFPINGVGITTAHDDFVIDQDKNKLLEKFEDFVNTERNADLLYKKFNVKKKKGWDILQGYNNIRSENNLEKFIQPISYRPFDNKYIFYEDKLVWRTVKKVLGNFANKENLGLITPRQSSINWSHSFICDKLSEFSLLSIAAKTGAGNIFPLYVYENNEKIPNINKEIWDKINEKVGEATPENVLDYIYAILHSPSYRDKYKEFLKIDFPRVPYPEDKKKFFEIAKIGEKLRGFHLMTDPQCKELITKYPISGGNIVDKIKYKDGKVYINDVQYFEDVPEIAWNFYIGGYQPAQKYLKDRKGRQLNSDEIEHYQKIIKVLVKTDRLMNEVDKIIN